jgi:hypothetical protein
LANFFLDQFDKEVLSLSPSRGYARWLDDFVIGTQDVQCAWKMISQLSVVARNSGLHLNPHKTKVLSNRDIRRSYLFSDQHKRLDALELDVVLRSDPPFNAKARKRFSQILDHCREFTGIGLGEVLLRRIYRIGALLDSSRLLSSVARDLTCHPNAASAITQYVASISEDERLADLVRLYLNQAENVYQTVEISLLLSLLRRPLSAKAKKGIGRLASDILAGLLPIQSDVSYGIAALLFQRCVGSTAAAKTLAPLKARLMRTSSPQAQRFALTALYCGLSPAARRTIDREKLSETLQLRFLYGYLASRAFDISSILEVDIERIA